MWSMCRGRRTRIQLHLHIQSDGTALRGVVGLSSGDVDSFGDDPQYMKYLVFETISTSLFYEPVSYINIETVTP